MDDILLKKEGVMDILLIGGSGFVGSAIARRLSAAGHNVRVATRRRERAKHLIMLPTADVVEANVHDPETLRRLMQGQTVVISLAGILRGDFQRVHVELTQKIVDAARATGIRRVVHISSLGAAPDALSAYHRSKAAGEEIMRGSGLDVTLLRPAVIFGQGDSFLSMFAEAQSVLPVMPVACPDAQFQPVWVEDVATAVQASLEHPESVGHSYDLGGPHVYTMHELMRYAGRTAGRAALLIRLADGLSYLQALFMELIPGAPMTRDNYLSMKKPNVCATQPCLPFGLPATALEAVAPGYLRGARSPLPRDLHREVAGRRPGTSRRSRFT